MAVGSTKFKNSIQLEPQSSDPSSPAEGDIFYSDGTPRDEGLHVYKDGAWEKIPLGAVSPSFTLVNKTANATLATSGEDIITADSTSGDITLTLPAASGNSGVRYSIIKTVAANTVIVDGNGAETINGELTFDLESQYDSVNIVCNGSTWYIESDSTVVSARYTVTSGQTLLNGTLTEMVYDTLGHDTHSAYNSSTGDYTVPIGGFYRVNANVILDSTAAWTGGEELALRIRVNGSDFGGIANHQLTVTDFFTINTDATLNLSQGDIVDITIKQTSGASVNVQVDFEFNYFEIIRIK